MPRMRTYYYDPQMDWAEHNHTNQTMTNATNTLATTTQASLQIAADRIQRSHIEATRMQLHAYQEQMIRLMEENAYGGVTPARMGESPRPRKTFKPEQADKITGDKTREMLMKGMRR